ncbi:hypothetical protein [Deinococcus sp. JMULE3]|uniref:hypothetical protein n=1 Tax=Deinococcus sp. JMULE3 TaxID=2518341 RepID=UPI0015777761|nr:hypothetical protein [Deinococcus sp. JMULE3]NTX99309.1 hypothetical protein [Deinococcus sp. JMULE3]
MIRVFGVHRYDAVMAMPDRLIARAATIEGERDAERRLTQLRDLSLAAGLKLGQQLVDPKNPSGRPGPGEAYHTLKPFNDHVEQLDQIAHPWEHTREARIARREAEEARRFDRIASALGRKP